MVYMNKREKFLNERERETEREVGLMMWVFLGKLNGGLELGNSKEEQRKA